MAGSSLGTAWIQIKPTTTGIASSLKSEISSGVTQASSSAKGTFSTMFSGLGSNVYSTFSSAFSKVASTTKSLFTTALTTVTAGLTTTVSSAISRIDTLNNASTVFTALGYSTESVNAAMDTLNDYLNGLPTTLDSAVSSVQLLSTTFGGIEEGTKYFQAINDAGLAFSATTDQIQGAITQLSQTSLDGALNAETWNSLLNNGFGPVLAVMAEQVGMTMGELKEAFSEGTYTVQDFLDMLVDLDENGTESMSSLAELARANTAGIATSFTNMGTAVTRGMASIIESIPDLTTHISSAGKAIETVLKGTSDGVCLTTETAVSAAAESIKQVLSDLISGVTQIASTMVPLILEVLPWLVDTVVDGLVSFLSDDAQVSKVIDGFVTLFTSILTGSVKIINAILPLIPDIISSLAEELFSEENKGYVIEAFAILLGYSTFKTIASNLGSVLTNTIGNKISSFFSKDVANVNVSSGMSTLSTKISNAITGISNVVSSLFTGLGQILASVVDMIMQPIKSLATGIGEAISGFFTALANPQIAVGAAMFAVAAAAIAAAIFLIGSAIGAVMPTITTLFNEVIMPLADFLVNTVILLIETLTNSIIQLTQGAIIPLGTFLTTSFVTIIDTVTDALVRLTNDAIIPLVETLSGGFTTVINAVANLITGTLQTALDGIANIVSTVGDAFTAMGNAIKTALDGVNGILTTFKDLILGIADAIVAVVALATGQSITYGSGYARVTKAATGGLVTGVGTDTSDSNLYALSRGEYVIRASSARKIGYDTLDQLNSSGSLNASNNVFNITVNEASDPATTAREVSRIIARKQKEVLA